MANPEVEMRLELLERAVEELRAEVARLKEQQRSEGRPIRVAGAGQALGAAARKKTSKELEVVCAVCGKAVLARSTIVTDQGAACADCYPTRSA